MDLAGVREALNKVPFEPFIIRLADGRGLPVPHRDFVAFTPRRVIVGAQNDSWSIVEPLLIASLESLSKKPKGGNGSHGKGPKSVRCVWSSDPCVDLFGS